MSMYPYSGPPPIEPQGDSKSFDYHIAGLSWALITLVVSLHFGKQEQLAWTPYLVTVPGALAIFLIFKLRLQSLRDQLIILTLSGLAMAACPFFEAEFIRRTQPLKPDPPLIITAISVEDLEELTFSGFRSKSSNMRSHVVLRIEEIEYQPHRVIFRYSLNEGLILTRGEGLVYPSTSTLQLHDGTIFHYQRENGLVTLLARNRADFHLLQTKGL